MTNIPTKLRYTYCTESLNQINKQALTTKQETENNETNNNK